MNESNIKKLAKKQLKALLKGEPFFWQEIETNTAVGVPDVYTLCRTTPAWLEAKQTAYKASPWQINWHIAHQKAGGRSYMLTYLTQKDCDLVCPGQKEGSIVLPIDPKQLDYSSLGAYLRAEKPICWSLSEWLNAITLPDVRQREDRG